MERNKIEGLFKDKLEGYVLEPSNEARERFQGMIQSKKRRVLIMRIGIAASVLLFAFAGIYSFRTLNTEKVDLTEGESSDVGYNAEIAIVDEVAGPGSIPSGEDEKATKENEMANIIKNSTAESSSSRNSPSGNSQFDTSQSYAIMAQGAENEKLKSEKDHQSSVGDDQEYEQLIENQVEESTYIEYFVATPENIDDEQSKDKATEDQVREPMKITIEYIASGNKDKQSETKRSNFYSKLDNMKTMNEVLGDLRSYKDRLFALDFKKEEKVNNEEKSKE
jgi:hypothetical protein